MRPDTIFFLIALSMLMVSMILFVIFGQKTVRNLRKNPATKNSLGIVLISGWDILNVMSALALPKKITRIIQRSPLAALAADSDLLEKYTTRCDRIMAKILYILLIASVLALWALIILKDLGVFQ
jgi:hypothetical protein